jgi:Dolichyl-phosphate-mannose-protein mannosyltransferase
MRRTCPLLFLALVATVSIGMNMDIWAVPRFDGAGYAVLGKALTTGHGYREINKPEAPPHDHFPPGYPVVLAMLWQFTGRSVVAAHVLSLVCTVMAVLLGWSWFRHMYSPRTALLLGLALAVNWTWARIGGSIQSEPLFILWELLAVCVTIRAERKNTVGIGVALGLIVGASTLTRHVGVCIAAAVILELMLCRHWKALTATISTTTLLIVPWIGWLSAVHHHTQLGLLTMDSLGARVAGQAVFYLQRLSDQITGPFVEVGTVMRRSLIFSVAANLWATMAFTIIMWGWVHTLRTSRRRMVGLISSSTLVLLLIWPFTEAGRFLIPLVPMILVGLTEGLGRLIRLVGVKRTRQWAVVIVLLVSVPYSAYSIINGRAKAQRRLHADFDAACLWIARETTGRELVLTRHPGEVFWQTGHPTIEPDSSNPDAIDRLINRLGVTYLLIDDERYMNADSNPLREYVRLYPGRAESVWGKSHGGMSVEVFKVIRSKS